MVTKLKSIFTTYKFLCNTENNNLFYFINSVVAGMVFIVKLIYEIEMKIDMICTAKTK